MVNLYAWRATQPPALFAAERQGANIVGHENDAWLLRTCEGAERIVAARGNHGRKARARRVLELLARTIPEGSKMAPRTV